jgi:cellulose 1,4-beta-cellobiosidase
MTLTNVGYGDNFTVQTNTRYTGRVRAFPDFLYGCSWGICSPHRTLPVKVSHDGDPVTSVDTAGNPRGAYDAAYDIWFSKGYALNGQAHGAEIMIWLRSTFGGDYGRWPLVRVDGALYRFLTWRAHNRHGSWNYMQFRKVSQVSSLHGIHVNDFIKVAERHGLINPDWYLQNITAGFEMVSGGKGLQMSGFSAQR